MRFFVHKENVERESAQINGPKENRHPTFCVLYTLFSHLFCTNKLYNKDKFVKPIRWNTHSIRKYK